MKPYQHIFVGTLLALFSIAFSEVTVEIISPPPGELIEPCQNVTFVADVQTTEGEQVSRVYFYDNDIIYLGNDRSAPWEMEMEQIKSGNHSITAEAQLADRTGIKSAPLEFTVGDDILPEECLYNGRFDDCDSTLPPPPWGFHKWRAEGTVSFDSIPELGHCVKIDVQSFSLHNIGLHVSLYQDVKLEKDHKYELSFLVYAPQEKIMDVDIVCRNDWDDVLLHVSTKMEGVQEFSNEFAIDDLDADKKYSLMIGAGVQTRPIYIKWVSLKDLGPVSDVEKTPHVVRAFKLLPAYPNPFNPTTTIAYNLQRPGNVKLTVYNALGEEVAELVNNFQAEGSHSVLFDAQHLPTGIYFYQLQMEGTYSEMKKMLLLR